MSPRWPQCLGKAIAVDAGVELAQFKMKSIPDYNDWLVPLEIEVWKDLNNTSTGFLFWEQRPRMKELKNVWEHGDDANDMLVLTVVILLAVQAPGTTTFFFNEKKTCAWTILKYFLFISLKENFYSE